jgi:PAS domain S-box-containing protein
MSRLGQFVRDLRLQRKLNLVVVGTCAVVLLLACAALFAFQDFYFRRALTRDLQTTAEIIAANSLGALTFKDRQAAADVLASLKAKPQITYARIELQDGTPFASLGTPHPEAATGAHAWRDGLRVEGRCLLLAQPIVLDGQRLGTLYLDADFRALRGELLRLYAGILTLVLTLSMLVGAFLSTRLQRLISEPILKLADTARAVAEIKDYSVRAAKLGRDEVGLLTDAFNQMLSQIEADATLLRNINLDLQSEITERERTEAARRAADQRFRSLTESAHDAILSLDSLGRITSWNTGAQRIFEFEEGEILGERIQQLLAPRHHASLAALTARLQSGQRLDDAQESIETEGVRKSGEEFPAELSLYAWQLGAEQCFGAILRDITQRKQAARELEALHKTLREASRQAGMAEVATGVLHNVGNILNSVNVSATLVTDRVRGSKVSGVARLAALFQEHAADLPEFLGHDPRGRQVPAYLASLAGHLAADQQTQLEELDALRRNLEHVKEIVAMQQTYAKVAGVIEILEPAALVEDALRINAMGLAAEKVEVIKQFEPVPAVAVDRHKVMQILVNLLRNAKHALQDGRASERRMTLRVAPKGPDRVTIEVSDNGVGIAPENLTRIFQHGFTTKKDGHGFGLHSGANAAKEMGGALSAHSEGPGRGATFTLELPVQAVTSALKAA